MGAEVLFVAADLPWPPDGGGRIATLDVLEGMTRRFSVDLVVLADPVGSPDLAHLDAICSSVHVVPLPFTAGRHRVRQSLVVLDSLGRRDPYRLLKFRSAAMRRLLADLMTANRYRLLHLDQFGVIQYQSASVATTHVTQNVESDIYRLGSSHARGAVRRTWSAIEARKLAGAEARTYPRIDHVFTLSDSDRALLATQGLDRLSVLPIPVDAPQHHPSRPPPARRSLLTLGSMSWFGVEDGLVWFHDEVWPLVRARVPEATWDLVGPNATSTVRAWAEEDGIVVHGYVADLTPLVTAARVTLIPLHIAGGVRIKLLDALARGRPVVATGVGAQGIPLADGEGAFIRDRPADFAAAVVALLTDDALWIRVGSAGWRYARQHHTRATFNAVLDAGVDAALAHFDARR